MDDKFVAIHDGKKASFLVQQLSHLTQQTSIC